VKTNSSHLGGGEVNIGGGEESQRQDLAATSTGEMEMIAVACGIPVEKRGGSAEKKKKPA